MPSDRAVSQEALTQDEFLHLAGWRLRERVEEAPMTRRFVRREMRPAIGEELFFGWPRPRSWTNEGRHHFTPFLVRDADHRGIGPVRNRRCPETHIPGMAPSAAR